MEGRENLKIRKTVLNQCALQCKLPLKSKTNNRTGFKDIMDCSLAALIQKDAQALKDDV